jgi:hypothetical protein
MMSIATFFGRKNRPLMLRSEEDSIKLSKDIFSLLVKCENNLTQLKGYLNSSNPYLKDAKIAELENRDRKSVV